MLMTDAEQQVVEAAPKLAGNMGMGRPKGVPNKITAAMRNTAHYIVEDRAEAFIQWLNRVAETKPATACNIYIKLIETYSAKPQAGFAFEAGTRTNERGESVIAMQLRSLLEAPVEGA